MNVLGVIVLAALCAGLGWYCGIHGREWEAASKAKEKTKGSTSTFVSAPAPAMTTVQRKLTRQEKKARRERGRELMLRRESDKAFEKKAREARLREFLAWKPEVRQVTPVRPRRSPSLFWSFLALGAAVHYVGASSKKDDTVEAVWHSNTWTSTGGDTCDMAGGSGALGNDCGVESFGAGDGDFLTGDTFTGSDSGFGGGDFGGGDVGGD